MDEAGRNPLRRIVIAVAGAATLFWIYTFFHIGRVANPKGDRLEWLAAMPMTFVFLVLVLPALIAGLSAKKSQRALKFAAALLAIGVIADLWLWSQILGEFAGKAGR